MNIAELIPDIQTYIMHLYNIVFIRDVLLPARFTNLKRKHGGNCPKNPYIRGPNGLPYLKFGDHFNPCICTGAHIISYRCRIDQDPNPKPYYSGLVQVVPSYLNWYEADYEYHKETETFKLNGRRIGSD